LHTLPAHGAAGQILLPARRALSFDNGAPDYSRNTALSSELLTLRVPLYSMKPSFLNL
jgi:hypothetical protein